MHPIDKHKLLGRQGLHKIQCAKHQGYHAAQKQANLANSARNATRTYHGQENREPNAAPRRVEHAQDATNAVRPRNQQQSIPVPNTIIKGWVTAETTEGK